MDTIAKVDTAVSSGPTAMLFLSDLPATCTKHQIESLFHDFGDVMNIQLCDDSLVHYGYVEMENVVEAFRAIDGLQGQLFIDRPLSISWSRPFELVPLVSSNGNQEGTGKVPMVQVLFSFICHQAQTPVSEDFIASVFNPFGLLVNVSIKRVNVNQEKNSQNGYGFVHFCQTWYGVYSAVKCVQWFKKKTVEGVTLDAKFGEQFRRFLHRNQIVSKQDEDFVAHQGTTIEFEYTSVHGISALDMPTSRTAPPTPPHPHHQSLSIHQLMDNNNNPMNNNHHNYAGEYDFDSSSPHSSSPRPSPHITPRSSANLSGMGPVFEAAYQLHQQQQQQQQQQQSAGGGAQSLPQTPLSHSEVRKLLFQLYGNSLQQQQNQGNSSSNSSVNEDSSSLHSQSSNFRTPLSTYQQQQLQQQQQLSYLNQLYVSSGASVSTAGSASVNSRGMKETSPRSISSNKGAGGSNSVNSNGNGNGRIVPGGYDASTNMQDNLAAAGGSFLSGLRANPTPSATSGSVNNGYYINGSLSLSVSRSSSSYDKAASFQHSSHSQPSTPHHQQQQQQQLQQYPPSSSSSSYHQQLDNDSILSTPTTPGTYLSHHNSKNSMLSQDRTLPLHRFGSSQSVVSVNSQGNNSVGSYNSNGGTSIGQYSAMSGSQPSHSGYHSLGHTSTHHNNNHNTNAHPQHVHGAIGSGGNSVGGHSASSAPASLLQYQSSSSLHQNNIHNNHNNNNNNNNNSNSNNNTHPFQHTAVSSPSTAQRAASFQSHGNNSSTNNSYINTNTNIGGNIFNNTNNNITNSSSNNNSKVVGSGTTGSPAAAVIGRTGHPPRSGQDYFSKVQQRQAEILELYRLQSQQQKQGGDQQFS